MDKWQKGKENTLKKKKDFNCNSLLDFWNELGLYQITEKSG